MADMTSRLGQSRSYPAAPVPLAFLTAFLVAAVATATQAHSLPSAVLSAPDSATVGEVVVANPARSESAGATTSFRWAVDGLAVAQFTSATPLPHVFRNVGSHVIELTVIDLQGGQDSTTHSVDVAPRPPSKIWDSRYTASAHCASGFAGLNYYPQRVTVVDAATAVAAGRNHTLHSSRTGALRRPQRWHDAALNLTI